MTWAVHNLNTPAVKIDADGCWSNNNGPPLKFGEPLFTADTKEKAEAIRLKRLKVINDD